MPTLAVALDFLTNLGRTLKGIETFFQIMAAIALAVMIILAIAALLVIYYMIAMAVTVLKLRAERRKAAVANAVGGPHRIDAKGLLRTSKDGTTVSMDWSEVDEVQAVTLDARTTAHSAFISLHNTALGKRVVVPLHDDHAPLVLQKLRSFPGFDAGRMQAAMSHKRASSTVVWVRA